MFPQKVEVNLDMLHALMLNGVGGDVDSADVVVIDEGALHQRSVEFLK
jgi:nucleoside-triphosphatase THEP1